MTISARSLDIHPLAPGHRLSTVTWEITWVGPSGTSGNFGQFLLTDTTRVVIAEAKALTCDGNNPCTPPQTARHKHPDLALGNYCVNAT
jgi:hypothetical protein